MLASCIKRQIALAGAKNLVQGLPCFSSSLLHSAGMSSVVERNDVDNNKPITRVLFCGPHFPASQNYTREYLEKYPFIQVDELPLEQVPDHIGNYDLCVAKNMRFDSNVLSRAKQMKLIMQFGVGLEGVDIDAATKHGIKVARIPGGATGNAASCAEMAIYLMLGLLRKQNEMQISVKQKMLGEPVGDTLLGKTIFILGFGNIGVELAKRLKTFGVKVIATKRSWPSSLEVVTPKAFPSQNEVIDDLIDKKGIHGDIYEFASNADIVVCCLSLNKDTVGIVNKSFVSSMKKGALLVNVARGALLDYEAVVHYLELGHLGGLGTDVAWREPFEPDDPILKFKNVILTPHVAGVTEHSYRTMSKVVGDVALQLHAGKPFTGIELVN
ncbi:D-isomer specific 2-hydroxyacid dehydrogenase family protein isoform 4 [Hibiscus syriacus]|uniref:D-isomer specific 2-hydroxyacid dehydrogenase family protein isoform 4 n=1 Tax=Hibiscus syriacus TaxID=106335 RepID=A0A6A2YSH6_HIBSY|nr:hydroxypyruvate reductase-like isoform X2 [Hibiscus syriacus]KAE8682438.1 D-isomer specific 2-hydroxyacid dehydrogenase family protein isoform 4 [Hibiscus syriacus]